MDLDPRTQKLNETGSVAIRDVYTGSRIRIRIHPESWIQGQLEIPDPGSASKNLSIFNPKTVSKLSEKLSGTISDDMGRSSRIPDPNFFPITDPGSATLETGKPVFLYARYGIHATSQYNILCYN